ncbi:hypothetical protein [Polynucleobacter necessarius]|uniref:hypothetical protein n=1 Tax=Polynucleobacter necessarius TaxID=576610 RepID=UPI0013B0687D|nr:hypothetical protein [Polynucleobacter necessarius]
MIKKIEKNNLLLGIVMQSSFRLKEGIEFITDENSEFQLGYMHRSRNYEVRPHFHIQKLRQISQTSEVLIVKTGSICVSFFDCGGDFVSSEELSDGDICMFVAGGHGVKFLEDSDLIEIKQGPHLPGHDKKFI